MPAVEDTHHSLKRYLWIAGPWTISVVTFVHVFVAPPDVWADLPQKIGISLFIAEICAAGCYWGSFVVSAAEAWIYRRLGRTYKARSAVVQMLRGSIVFMLPAMHVAFVILAAIASTLHIPWRTPNFSGYRFGLLMGMFTASLWIVFDLYRDNRESIRRIQDLEHHKLKAQLAALTSQMNPHLLFNALNSIASLIRQRPDAAEDMTMALSALYRQVLQASKRDTHRLSDELNLCRAYLEIEKARFEERLEYAIDVAIALDPDALEVPVLCLQPIVENGVKHGLLTKSIGGRLSINVVTTGDVIRIEVVDDGVGFGSAPLSKGSGTSVANCRERLAIMYGSAGSLIIEAANPGTRAILSIPATGLKRST